LLLYFAFLPTGLPTSRFSPFLGFVFIWVYPCSRIEFRVRVEFWKECSVSVDVAKVDGRVKPRGTVIPEFPETMSAIEEV